MNENTEDEIGNKFCVEFKTSSIPNRVVATQVTLESIIMAPKDSVKVNLVDHPLYKNLEQYVLANPSEDHEEDA